jgi:hypothetical protein
MRPSVKLHKTRDLSERIGAYPSGLMCGRSIHAIIVLICGKDVFVLKCILYATAIVALISVPVFAQDFDAPTGDVLLTVSGLGEDSNADGTALFDLEMLQTLGGSIVETSTIWTNGTHTFQGVPLYVFVKSLGISGETLRATAVNNYSVDIPLSDAVENGPIIAYRMDGKLMSVRDKGPLWIIYRYDDDVAFRSEVIYSRSIWQVDRLEVLK